jgi:hypothetical protein
MARFGQLFRLANSMRHCIFIAFDLLLVPIVHH